MVYVYIVELQNYKVFPFVYSTR